MTTGSSSWVLTITQAKCALANPTSCMILQTEKGFIKNTWCSWDDMIELLNSLLFTSFSHGKSTLFSLNNRLPAKLFRSWRLSMNVIRYVFYQQHSTKGKSPKVWTIWIVTKALIRSSLGPIQVEGNPPTCIVITKTRLYKF